MLLNYLKNWLISFITLKRSKTMEILAKIENMYYEPMLCKNLNEYSLDDIRSGFAFKDASFKLRLNTGEIIAFSNGFLLKELEVILLQECMIL
jgi:hypothetical protein